MNNREILDGRVDEVVVMEVKKGTCSRCEDGYKVVKYVKTIYIQKKSCLLFGDGRDGYFLNYPSVSMPKTLTIPRDSETGKMGMGSPIP